MYGEIKGELIQTLAEIDAAGLRKAERSILSAQAVEIIVDGQPMLNFCANNYLGLADHPDVIAAAHSALDSHGFGMASVRFICGTGDLHLELERKLSDLTDKDDTILFPSCFDANGGVFEVLLTSDDAVISDELNHASIIDGIRLSKAQRFRYMNRDLTDLEVQLQAASTARRKLIVTDGVFSMDGYFAPLPEICDLAEKYGAMVMVDDSHAVGFIGETGAGTAEMFGVQDRVDIITGTLGKALGGASGGYVSAHQEIVNLLRQRARPYLFSNAVAPAAVAGSIAALDLVAHGRGGRLRLHQNAELFRTLMTEAGFTLQPGSHPIIPVMFDSEPTAGAVAQGLGRRGIYAVAFSYPVVPLGKARIRIQISASHTEAHIRQCVEAFVDARAESQTVL